MPDPLHRARPTHTETYTPHKKVAPKHTNTTAPRPWPPALQVLSAAGSDGLLEIKAGDRVSSRKLDLVLTPTRSLYNYPFDQYVTTVK